MSSEVFAATSPLTQAFPTLTRGAGDVLLGFTSPVYFSFQVKGKLK